MRFSIVAYFKRSIVHLSALAHRLFDRLQAFDMFVTESHERNYYTHFYKLRQLLILILFKN